MISKEMSFRTGCFSHPSRTTCSQKMPYADRLLFPKNMPSILDPVQGTGKWTWEGGPRPRLDKKQRMASLLVTSAECME